MDFMNSFAIAVVIFGLSCSFLLGVEALCSKLEVGTLTLNYITLAHLETDSPGHARRPKTARNSSIAAIKNNASSASIHNNTCDDLIEESKDDDVYSNNEDNVDSDANVCSPSPSVSEISLAPLSVHTQPETPTPAPDLTFAAAFASIQDLIRQSSQSQNENLLRSEGRNTRSNNNVINSLRAQLAKSTSTIASLHQIVVVQAEELSTLRAELADFYRPWSVRPPWFLQSFAPTLTLLVDTPSASIDV
ncbi:hypothetical protein BC830DRAFT_1175118 [Chytriomyces sp. MP71]|nr:hypothetical protein BC830DRAFT_1175118 [Chytriomyces sp. MP71]